MACSDYRASRLYRSELDRKLGGFLHPLASHTATEMACGFVPPVALLAGLFARGRTLLREIKWELGLLVAILILSMLPSISVFRWSFRWLPFLHVVLALCAAEALRSFNRQQRAVSESDKSERTTVRRPPITPGLLAIVLVGLITLCFVAFPHLWPTFLPLGLDMPRDRGKLGDTRKDKITRVGAPLRCLRLTTRDLSLSFTQRWRSEIQSCPRTDDASAS
jgi:4-amino-4-deoxy-L-arabinose transferase-like glycosyltransferase